MSPLCSLASGIGQSFAANRSKSPKIVLALTLSFNISCALLINQTAGRFPVMRSWLGLNLGEPIDIAEIEAAFLTKYPLGTPVSAMRNELPPFLVFSDGPGYAVVRESESNLVCVTDLTLTLDVDTAGGITAVMAQAFGACP